MGLACYCWGNLFNKIVTKPIKTFYRDCVKQKEESFMPPRAVPKNKQNSSWSSAAKCDWITVIQGKSREEIQLLMQLELTRLWDKSNLISVTEIQLSHNVAWWTRPNVICLISFQPNIEIVTDQCIVCKSTPVCSLYTNGRCFR